MYKKYAVRLGILILMFSILQCKQQPDPIVKNHSKDPFKSTIAPSQFFKIDTKKDTVIAGQKGTLLVFQKGSFIDANENVVTTNIDIELTEAHTLDDMLLSNLTTTSGDQLLETDGMIYFNATSEGKQLFVNPDKPVYIEIPTKERKPGMSVYKGIRDENGNMDWIDPIPIENHLLPVDLFTLDFLPDGFVETVEKEMPFRNYESADEKLIDSLYYSLSFKTGNEILVEEVPETNVNETYYDNRIEGQQDSLYASENIITEVRYGVDPAIIKAIKNRKFQNTLIATRQFEERLKVMFKICRTDMIDVYVRNLDKNLWELDSIAATLLDDNVYQEDFQKFASQRWTTIKESNKNLKLLKRFYEKRLKRIKKQLTNQRNKVVKANNKKTKEAKKLIESYKKLLNEREAYRMTGYGFTMTATGWLNIDRGTRPKDWGFAPLEFVVKNDTAFDRVYAYVVYTSIKSLYRLNSKDLKTFYVGNETQREMIMPKDERAIGIVIAYQAEQLFLKVLEFQTNSLNEFEFTLQETTKREIKKTLSKLETEGTENSILKDLRYLDKIYLEEIRQDKLEHERYVMAVLKKAASAQDTSYMRYSRIFGIDMPIDSCTNNTRGSKPWSSRQ